MNYSLDIYSKLKNLPEVVSENHFHNLFDEFVENISLIEDKKQIEILEILGDNFGKFYNINKLNSIEKNFITKKLINLTKFSDLNRMCELTGLMFSFLDNNYFEFLNESLKTAKIPSDVKIEIMESIEEYEKTIYNKHTSDK